MHWIEAVLDEAPELASPGMAATGSGVAITPWRIDTPRRRGATAGSSIP